MSEAPELAPEMPSDADMFNSVMDEAAPVLAEHSADEQGADSGINRDDHGRFAPKVAETAAPEVVAAPAKPEPVRLTADEWAAFSKAQTAPIAPAAPAEPAAPPQFWDDPNAAVQHQARELLTPVQQHMQQLTLGYSRRFAVQEFGAETVNEAIEAIRALGQSNPAEYQRLDALAARSIDPVGDLVRWNKEASVRAKIASFGNDPEAYINAEIERRMAEKQAEAGGDEAPSAPARGKPALPPSLSRMPSGKGQPTDSDMSDSALFSFATH